MTELQTPPSFTALTAHPSGNGRGDASRTPTLGDVVACVRRHRRFVFLWPLIAAVVTAVVVLIIPPRFGATTRFTADSPTPRGGLESAVGGLAAQAGLLFGATGGQTSPLYYAAVLRSRELLEHVVQLPLRVPDSPSDSADLLSQWRVRGDSPALRLDKAVRRLGRRMDISVDRPTGVISLSVQDESPIRAADIANRLVLLLDQFNLERRRTRAQRRRVFVEARVREAQAQLAGSEERLERFEAGNRMWRSSPPLTLTHDRLRRQVDIDQDVFLTLRREFETARVDEVNDVPVLTVVDHAAPPVRKSYPRRTLSVLLAFGIALGVTVFTAVLLGQDRTPLRLIPRWGTRRR